MDDGRTIPVARLLAHTGWMRSLARSLVADEALAEDLVQESLLCAVARPPRREGALGSWLRTVLRRLAIRAHREGRSRERRERAAARPERSETTPAEVLERVEVQGQLVDLVLTLEEPYRSAVLLRYFEGWNAEDIARRQGIDPTTARWRVRKGVERLRERLDRLNGSRTAWCAAFVSLLGTGREAEAAGLACAAGPAAEMGTSPSIVMASRWILSGVAVMKLKSVVTASVLSFLLLLGLIIHFTRPREEERVPPRPDHRAAVPIALSVPPRALPLAEARPAEIKTEEAASASALLGGAAVAGLVIDAETDDPVPGAEVRVRGSDAKAVTVEDGSYRLEGLPTGEQYLIAAAQGYAEEHSQARVEEGGEFLQDFRLEPAVELLVTVVDPEGKPLERVQVTPAQPNGGYVQDERYTRLTDREGKALIAGIGRTRKQQVNARKLGYHEVWTRDYEIEPERDRAELSIVMEERPLGDGVVDGRVTGPGGGPLQGIHVQWIHSHGEQKGRVVTETALDGSYRLVFPREQDWCAVSAFGAGFAPAAREGVRPGTKEEPARVDFTLTAGRWLEGEVLDEDGRPVEGASVRAMPTIYLLRNTPLHPGNVREALTDGRGRFSLKDLSGPTVALRILGPPGGDWGNNYHPQVEVDRRVTLRLLGWGVIRGRVLDRETGEPVSVFGIKLKKGVGYYDYHRSDPGEFFNAAEGLFELKKLDQGPIELLVEAGGYIPKWVQGVAAEPEDGATVHAVRITRGRILEGTVVDGASGAPISGARVVFGAWGQGDLSWDEGSFRKMPDRQEVQTGPDGGFRVREGEPGTLFFHRPGYARLALPPAEREGFADASGRLRVALESGGTLSGVLFEDGWPSRRGFLVLFRKRGGETGREWIGNLDRDAEGRFRVEELPGGEYFLEHWRETPGKRTAGLSIQRALRIEAGTDQVMDFGADLGPLAVQGRGLGRDGKPLDRVRLTLRPEFECSYTEFAASVTSEHDGRFHFLGLRPGKYRVEASDRRGAKTTLEPLQIEADLERDLELPSEE